MGAKRKDGPTNNKGMTYQTDGKHVAKTTVYLVCIVNIETYGLKEVLY